ncbi:transposase [Frateuria sp. GZRR35]|uniref:REP-associated tyrosine transposase n=1 Tax=Frateuria sp. GZRR35 TaxID=3351536 RepID=UPI003EDC1F2D
MSLPSQVYLLTVVTQRWRKLFADAAMAAAASRCMVHPDCWGDAQLLAWVLMPDHWHGLVQLGYRDDLSLVMNRMKAVVSRKLGLEHGPGTIWARGFHDRAMRQEDDLRAAARYIVANPVRAGMVSHACDYPYWDCVWL